MNYWVTTTMLTPDDTRFKQLMDKREMKTNSQATEISVVEGGELNKYATAWL